MKNYFTWITTILFAGLLSMSSFAQSSEAVDKRETIKRFLMKTKTDSPFVTIKIKPGGQLGSLTSSGQIFPRGKTLIGEITYISDVGFSLKRPSNQHTDFVYFDVVSEARSATQAELNWNKFTQGTSEGVKNVGKVAAGLTVGLTYGVYILLTGQFCC